jgi:hypothetical protein
LVGTAYRFRDTDAVHRLMLAGGSLLAESNACFENLVEFIEGSRSRCVPKGLTRLRRRLWFNALGVEALGQEISTSFGTKSFTDVLRGRHFGRSM